MVTRTRLNIKLYIHCASCYFMGRAQSFLCKLILPRLNIQKLQSTHSVYDSWTEQRLFLAAALTDGFAGVSSCGCAFRWTKSWSACFYKRFLSVTIWKPRTIDKNIFSILCLTTDVSTKVMRKKSVTSARSRRNTSVQPGDRYGVTSRWLYENTSAQSGVRYGVTSRWLYEKTNLAASNKLRA